MAVQSRQVEQGGQATCHAMNESDLNDSQHLRFGRAKACRHLDTVGELSSDTRPNKKRLSVSYAMTLNTTHGS